MVFASISGTRAYVAYRPCVNLTLSLHVCFGNKKAYNITIHFDKSTMGLTQTEVLEIR